MGLSGKLVKGNGAPRWGYRGEKGLKAAHGFWRQEDVAASVADLGGDVINHDNLITVLDGMNDSASFIHPGASYNHFAMRFRTSS